MTEHFRAIALHESYQLRRFPPRLWHHVYEESRGRWLLLAANGRNVTVVPLELDPQGRWQ